MKPPNSLTEHYTTSFFAADQVHLPIGIPNSVDTLKTFVEADGTFSPGFATYGISLVAHDGKRGWIPDLRTTTRGLSPSGYLIP